MSLIFFLLTNVIVFLLAKKISIYVPLQLRTAGSNVLFAAITEISDSVLKGAEASGVNGMVLLSDHAYKL